MKKLISALLLAATAFTAQATVYTYENEGFYDYQSYGWWGKYVESDISLSYDDSSDLFNFELTQYSAKHDYSHLRLIISDGGAPTSSDLDLALGYYGDDYASGYQTHNWDTIDGSTYSTTFGTDGWWTHGDNSYSFEADLTDALVDAGNTNGLYGDTVGVWLFGYTNGSYHSIFDAYNLSTVASNVSSSVSEPAPLALLMLSLAGLFMARKRRA